MGPSCGTPWTFLLPFFFFFFFFFFYKYNHCGKAFTRRGLLQKHVRIYNEDKPYKYDYCGRSFTQQGLLQQCVRIHARDKPYKCNHCCKGFTQLGILQLHVKLHTECKKMVREKSRECHNHKLQPFSDTKRKRKETKPNKCKSNKSTKNTKISSLFPKRGNRNAKRTEKHKNKITQGKM